MSNKRHDFSQAKVVLVEPDSGVRRLIAAAMRSRSFDNVVVTDSIGQLEDLAGTDLLDLIICDVETNGNAFVGFHNLIRKGGHGPNPYVSSIATTSDRTEDNIRAVINSGIDNILLKPLSVAAIIDRVMAIIASRKDFVVAAEYIGPDRRVRPRQQVSMPLVTVPNTLKARAEGSYVEAQIKKDIAIANALINEQRTTQSAVLINEIVLQIIPFYAENKNDDSILIHLHHLLRTAHDLAHRNRSTNREVADLCSAMIPIVQKVTNEHRDPAQKDLHLMKDLATAIFMAYGTVDKIEAMSTSIAESIKNARRFSGA